MVWYDTNYTYKKKITIDSTKCGSDGPYSNFPILVSWSSDSDLSSACRSDGFDILFTNSAESTKLDHERILYTSGTGALTAWVEVTSLSSSSDTDIYMYYGYASATDQQNVTGTWNSNFKSVCHLQSDGTDSTSNGYDGTVTGATATSAKIGNGYSYDGTNDTINRGTITEFNGASKAVVSLLLNMDSNSSNDGALSVTDQANHYNGLSVYSDDLYWDCDPAFGHITGSTYIPSSTWVLIHWVFDGTATGDTNRLKLYTQGTNRTYTLDGSGVPATIGFANAVMQSGGPLNGYVSADVDELRVVVGDAYSAGWCLSEYNNQNSPSTFYTVGSQQTQAATRTLWSGPSPQPII